MFDNGLVTKYAKDEQDSMYVSTVSFIKMRFLIVINKREKRQSERPQMASGTDGWYWEPSKTKWHSGEIRSDMNTYSNTCESDFLEPNTQMTPTDTCLTPEDSTKNKDKALTIQVPLERHQIYLAHADECAGMESGTQLTGKIHWERCLRL